MRDSRSSSSSSSVSSRLRSAAWHQQRRARGLCSQAPCPNRPDVNPRTGVPFWKCRACRLKQSLGDAARVSR